MISASKRVVLGMLVLAGAASAPAQKIKRLSSLPAEGLVLRAKSTLERARLTAGYRILPIASPARITSWKQLQAKPPNGVWRLDRQRRHQRDKELGRRQGGSLLRGLATELIYKNRRKKAEGR
jgi:hypothetical protein